MKRYKFGFDFPALVLFLLIMTPNLIWFSVPAPNDVLRTASSPAILDTTASICQVLMVTTLCLLIDRDRERLRATPPIVSAVACCLLYFVSWAVYYAGIVSAPVIFGLTLLPCGAFLLFAVDRRNMIAAGFASLFTLLHFAHGIMVLI